MLQTNVDSLKINYMDKGSGELVVLLHGWGSNIELFENMSELLAQISCCRARHARLRAVRRAEGALAR